jgi:hypothetical protein
MSLEELLRLGEFAINDPSLLKNHFDNEIPLRIAKTIKEENLFILDSLGEDYYDKEFIGLLQSECLRAFKILKFYLSNLK